MAAGDDDLDAFFDEVEEVEKETLKEIEGDGDGEIRERPSKKARTELQKGTDTGRAVVVVAKAAVTVIASSAPTSSSLPSSIHRQQHPPSPSLPPSRPVASVVTQLGSYYPSSTTTTVTTNATKNPPVPPPPPPPPLPPQPSTSHSHKPPVRTAAGKKWVDPTLAAFPPNDFRLFVGNLSKDVNDATLAQAFSKYPSFAMARVCYTNDKKSGNNGMGGEGGQSMNTGTSKEFGFVSLMDPKDCAKAIREMDQSWLGSRPIKVKRSEWKERNLEVVKRNGRKMRRKKGKDRW